jgi:tRNA(Ile)-lysidine synthase
MAFERVRWRRAAAELADLGLTPTALAATAQRAARARAGLDHATAALVRAAGTDAVVSQLGFASFGRSWWLGLPDEFRVRVLATAIAAFGGAREPVPLTALEERVADLARPACRGFTLHGAQVIASATRIAVVREPHGTRGAGQPGSPAPVCALQPGAVCVWDQRFELQLSADAPQEVEVHALGSAGVGAIRRAGGRLPAGVPARALWALPALWRDRDLLAVPALDYWTAGLRAGQAACKPRRMPFEQSG